MAGRRIGCRAAFSAALLLALLEASPALALSGEVTHLSGAALAQRAGQSRILSLKSAVDEGDVIATTNNTYVRIRFTDGGDVVLRPNTQIKIDAYKFEERQPQADGMALSLLKGGLRSVSGLLGRRTPGAFRLTTATSTVGIRGTSFGALLCNGDCADVASAAGGTPANGLHVEVTDGTVVLASEVGQIEIRVGEFGYAAALNAQPVLIPAGEGTRFIVPADALGSTVQGGTVGKGSVLECALP